MLQRACARRPVLTYTKVEMKEGKKKKKTTFLCVSKVLHWLPNPLHLRHCQDPLIQLILSAPQLLLEL
jgi:trans-aconitate methyltransferase